MQVEFEQVLEYEDKKISEVYQIIKASGEYMLKEQGLVHWSKPYPLADIKKNCVKRRVFLARNLDGGNCVHTFQLEMNNSNGNKNENIAIINKFATLPSYAGNGIGKLSMNYIENYCMKMGITKISLNVYEKSEHAIQFYKNRGYVITGSKPTKNFRVYLMEKGLVF